MLGAGAWAYVRSRGSKRKGPTDSTTTQSDPTADARPDTGSSRTGTAVKDRPAAPSWADTLSAPTAKPGAKPVAQDPQAAGAPGTEAPFDQEALPEPTTGEGRGETAEPSVPAADGTAATGSGATDTATADPATAVPAIADTAAADTATTAEPGVEASAPGSESREAPSAGPVIETPEAPADRMVRLRERLSRSGALGRGILTLLTRSGSVDEATWDEIEETLLMADLGPDATDEMLENLRRRLQVLGADDADGVREILRDELVSLVNPDLDRRLAASRREAADGTMLPSVMLMVGVNGTGKTTTVGKLARVLVAADRTVVLGAADTFRAAAADQLETWGSRVGVATVRADRDGADPAAVAFDAVKEGIAQEVDVVIIDTAGRLQNKKGLMDELGKVRRVAEKGLHGDSVSEVLLVIDATTGQNGMQQARVFSEAVNITGIVLTKLDGTAKGGIVVNVQRELGVPVKMVGLGEGMDDLTPFDPYGFVDALLEA